MQQSLDNAHSCASISCRKLVNSLLVNISAANIALDYYFYEQAANYLKKALGLLTEIMMPGEVGGLYSAKLQETYGWLQISEDGYVDPVVNEFFKKSDTCKLNLLRAQITDANTYLHVEMIKHCLEKSLTALNEKNYEVSVKHLESLQHAIFVEAKDKDLPMEKLRDKLILARNFVIFENTKIALSALSQAQIYFDLNKKLFASNPKNKLNLHEISAHFEEVKRGLSNPRTEDLKNTSTKLTHLIEQMDHLQ